MLVGQVVGAGQLGGRWEVEGAGDGPHERPSSSWDWWSTTWASVRGHCDGSWEDLVGTSTDSSTGPDVPETSYRDRQARSTREALR